MSFGFVPITNLMLADCKRWCGIEFPVQSFISEAEEIMDAFENFLLTLENNSDPASVSFSDCKRDIHTLKGAASLFGFNEFSEIVHLVETGLAKPVVEVQSNVENYLFALDVMRTLLTDDAESNAELMGDVKKVKNLFD